MRRNLGFVLVLVLLAPACSDDSSGGADQAAAGDSKVATPDAGKAEAGKPDLAADQKLTADNKVTVDQKPADWNPPGDTKTTKDLPPADLSPTLDAGSMSCSAMVNAFATARQEAKRCDRTKPDCKSKVIGSIYPMCPCPTFVNSAKTAAMAKMTSLRAAFAAAKCTGPACKCANPLSAVCQIPPGGKTAECEDKLTP